MTSPRPTAGPLPRLLCAALALSLSHAGAASGFFDGVPRKGYVRDDVSLDVLSAADGGRSPVATVRYVRLALDPGRRDVVWDFWPEREMLLVQLASGDRLVFERLSRLPEPRDPQELQPRGRVGLEGGVALELLSRSAAIPIPSPPSVPIWSMCDALDTRIRSGSQELWLARADLDTQTVRLAIGRITEAALAPRDAELITQTIPILLAARSQGLPVGALEVLELFYPGRTFAPAAQGLAFRTSAGAPLNPADGSWRSVTEAPEMLSGVPVL